MSTCKTRFWTQFAKRKGFPLMMTSSSSSPQVRIHRLSRKQPETGSHWRGGVHGVSTTLVYFCHGRTSLHADCSKTSSQLWIDEASYDLTVKMEPVQNSFKFQWYSIVNHKVTFPSHILTHCPKQGSRATETPKSSSVCWCELDVKMPVMGAVLWHSR